MSWSLKVESIFQVSGHGDLVRGRFPLSPRRVLRPVGFGSSVSLRAVGSIANYQGHYLCEFEQFLELVEEQDLLAAVGNGPVLEQTRYHRHRQLRVLRGEGGGHDSLLFVSFLRFVS